MGDEEGGVEALQKEAEQLKAKLMVERSKVSDKSCMYSLIAVYVLCI